MWYDSLGWLLNRTILAALLFVIILTHLHTHPSWFILFIEWIIPLNDIYATVHTQTMHTLALSITFHSIIELFIETKSILKPRTEWIIWKWFSLSHLPPPAPYNSTFSTPPTSSSHVAHQANWNLFVITISHHLSRSHRMFVHGPMKSTFANHNKAVTVNIPRLGFWEKSIIIVIACFVDGFARYIEIILHANVNTWQIYRTVLLCDICPLHDNQTHNSKVNRLKSLCVYLSIVL